MAKRGRTRRAASAAGRGARALGKWSVQGAKGSAAAAAAGVVAYVGVKMISGNNKDGIARFEMAQKHPIGTGIAVIAGGHFLKRKYQSLGAGVIGAGAALTALAYDLNRPAKSETSALTQPGDIGALTRPQDIAGALDAFDEVVETQGPGDNAEMYELGEAAGLGI